MSLVLAALLALSHPPALADMAVAADTIEPLALDAPLWLVSSETAPGSPEVAATALLLAAIGYHESGFSERVRRCLVRGPGGSVGAYQLLGSHALGGWTADEVCASDDVSARAALGVLRRHRDRCPTCVPAQWVAGYASGDMGRGSRAAREIVGVWSTLCRASGLVCEPYSRGGPSWIVMPSQHLRRMI